MKITRKLARTKLADDPQPIQPDEPTSALWPDWVLAAWLCDDANCREHEPAGGRP